MKKHLSILMLAARSTAYKLICLLLVMAAAQVGLFWVVLKIWSGLGLGLEQAVSQSRISHVFAVCFLLLCALLCMAGCELRGSKLSYTIRRLSISEKTVTLLWSAHNAVCFIIFWAAELAVLLLLCRIYMRYGNPEHISGQTVFLAFYRSRFLHSILPLEEGSRLVRNVFLALSLGVSSACFSYCMRHGKRRMAIVTLAAVTIVFFQKGMGSFAGDMALSILAAITAAISISGLWGTQNDEV